MQPRFSVLLWLEELHAQRELKEFSISGALLKKGARYLHLDVPGLAEGRPHLNFGENMTVANVCLEAVFFFFFFFHKHSPDECIFQVTECC